MTREEFYEKREKELVDDAVDDAELMAETLRQIRDLPCTDGSGQSDAKARRNAMYEYCYAKRDHLEHFLGDGKRMLKTVLADIERLHEEERQKQTGEDDDDLHTKRDAPRPHQDA